MTWYWPLTMWTLLSSISSKLTMISYKGSSRSLKSFPSRSLCIGSKDIKTTTNHAMNSLLPLWLTVSLMMSVPRHITGTLPMLGNSLIGSLEWKQLYSTMVGLFPKSKTITSRLPLLPPIFTNISSKTQRNVTSSSPMSGLMKHLMTLIGKWSDLPLRPYLWDDSTN